MHITLPMCLWHEKGKIVLPVDSGRLHLTAKFKIKNMPNGPIGLRKSVGPFQNAPVYEQSTFLPPFFERFPLKFS